MVMTTSQASARLWGVGAMSAPFSANALITPSLLQKLQHGKKKPKELCIKCTTHPYLASATDKVLHLLCISSYDIQCLLQEEGFWKSVASWWYWRRRMMKLYLSWTIRSWPALRRLDTICAPMLPSPTNPTLCCHTHIIASSSGRG